MLLGLMDDGPLQDGADGEGLYVCCFLLLDTRRSSVNQDCTQKWAPAHCTLQVLQVWWLSLAPCKQNAGNCNVFVGGGKAVSRTKDAGNQSVMGGRLN